MCTRVSESSIGGCAWTSDCNRAYDIVALLHALPVDFRASLLRVGKSLACGRPLPGVACQQSFFRAVAGLGVSAQGAGGRAIPHGRRTSLAQPIADSPAGIVAAE